MIKQNEVIVLRKGENGIVYPPIIVVDRKDMTITLTAVNANATVVLPRNLYDRDVPLRRGESVDVVLRESVPEEDLARPRVHPYSVLLEDAVDFAKGGSSPIIIIR